MASFKNSQWIVNDHGMQAIRPVAPKDFKIEASQLLDLSTAGLGDLYAWPLEMAKKVWVDIQAFVEAYLAALDVHEGKYQGTPDAERLQASIDRAFHIVEKRENSHWL